MGITYLDKGPKITYLDEPSSGSDASNIAGSMLEPGLREIVGAAAAIPQGYGEIASAVTGDKKYKEAVSKYTTPPEITEGGGKATEAYNWLKESVGGKVMDFLKSMDAGKRNDPTFHYGPKSEAFDTTLYETVVPLAVGSIPFAGAGKIAAPRRPTVVPPEVEAEAARRAAPPPPEAPPRLQLEGPPKEGYVPQEFGSTNLPVVPENTRRPYRTIDGEATVIPESPMGSGTLDRPITPSPVRPEPTTAWEMENQMAAIDKQMRESQAAQSEANLAARGEPNAPNGPLGTRPAPPVPPELSVEGQLAEQMRQSQAGAVRPSEPVMPEPGRQSFDRPMNPLPMGDVGEMALAQQMRESAAAQSATQATRMAEPSPSRPQAVNPEAGLLDQMLREAAAAKKAGDTAHVKAVESLIDEYKNAPHPLGGVGKKQGGAINFWGKKDPAFEKYKEGFPEHMRPYVTKELWEKHEGGKARAEIAPGENAAKALSNIKGIDKVVEDWGSDTLPPEEAIRVMKMEPPEKGSRTLVGAGLSQAGGTFWDNAVVTGARMKSFSTNSPLIRYEAKVVANADHASHRLKVDMISDEKTGLSPKLDALVKLDKDAVTAAMKQMQDFEGKPDDLKGQPGIKGQVIDAIRKTLDETHAMLNDTLKSLGKSALNFRDNFLPGTFNAEFKIEVKDPKTGKWIVNTGTFNRWSAEKLRAKLVNDYPGMEVSPVNMHKINSLEKPGSLFNMTLMEELFGRDSPEMANIESMRQKVLDMEAFQVGGTRKHFLNKSKEGIKGGPGNKPWESDVTNAQESIQNIIRYVEGAIEWAEWQKAAQKMDPILKDTELQSKYPRAYNYVKTHWDIQSGARTWLSNFYDSAVDRLVPSTSLIFGGIGRVQSAQILRATKAIFTTSVLTTSGFIFSQAVQSQAGIIAISAYLYHQGVTHNPVMAQALASFDMSNGLAGKRTPLGEAAMKWLDVTHRLDPHIFDDFSSLAAKGPTEAMRRIGEKAGVVITKADQYTRAYTFMHTVHALSEKMPLGPKLFDTAMNMTDEFMVNYREHARPMALQQTGELGRSIGTFMTYPLNAMNQYQGLGKRAKWVLGAVVAFQILQSGTQGIMGMDELDGIIDIINTKSAEGGHTSIPRIPSNKEFWMGMNSSGQLRTKPGFDRAMSYGLTSTIMNADMSQKLGLANPIPNSASELTAKPAIWFGKMIGDTVDALMSPTNAQKTRTAVHTVLPSALKWTSELEASSKMVDPKTGETKWKVPNAKTGELQYVRTKEDWYRRVHSLYSLDEADSRNAGRVLQQRENYYKTMSDALVKKFVETKDRDTISEWIKFTGKDANAFNAAMQSYAMKHNLTKEQLMMLNAKGMHFQFLRNGG